MRDYDPTTGRYIQADPLGLVDGASIYGYALQNPGRYTDPKGEQGLEGLLGTSFGRRALSLAGGAAMSDSPVLPIGDAIGLCILGAALTYCAAGGEFCVVQSTRPPGFWDAKQGAREWGRRNGVPPREAVGTFHGIKQGTHGSRGDDDYSVNPETGDVADQNGEPVGNLGDG